MHRFVFLHGFTQTHHHWHAAAHLLADRVGPSATLAFVDLPGHGLAADDLHGDFDVVGQRLVRLAGPGTYIGYSMGGRVAVAAAATGAPEVERLVLIGATAGISDETARVDRARLDEERAQRVEQLGVDAFLEEWMAMPMFARLPHDDDDIAGRRRNTAAGLAHSLRAYGSGAQSPLWGRLETIDVPVLVLAGELDTKFVELGARMARTLPDATFATVPRAGHAAHLERSRATVGLMADWLVGPPDQPSARPTASSAP